jgi:hypothetical protein
MLICNVFTDKNNQFSKLIIQPEITDGSEQIEIQLTPEQALEIKALEQISNGRE